MRPTSHKWLYVVLSIIALIIIVFLVGWFINIQLDDRAITKQLSALTISVEKPIYSHNFDNRCEKDGYGYTVCGSVGAKFYKFNNSELNTDVAALTTMLKNNNYKPYLSSVLPSDVKERLQSAESGGSSIYASYISTKKSSTKILSLDIYCYTPQININPFSQELSPQNVNQVIYSTIAKMVGHNSNDTICGYIIADGF
jgi:hypothetical protein